MATKAASSLLLACLLLTAVSGITSDKQGTSASAANDAVFPLIVEYISDYSIKTNDLDDVIQKQYAQITIGTVKTSYAEVKNPSFTLEYKDKAFPTYISPTKVEVANDTYSIRFSFTVVVNHTVGKGTYVCSYTTDDITVNYTKEVNLISGNTEITAFKSSFNQHLFEATPTCTTKPTDKDMTRIKEAVSNSGSSSIYLELNKIFSKMQDGMQENAKTEHLSEVYPDNPYVYDYYGNKMTVNVSTLATKEFGEKGLINQMQGTVEGGAHVTSAVPSALEDYDLFISKEFVMNTLDYYMKTELWKHLIVNRTSPHTAAWFSFKHRLIDYEDIVPSVLKQYPSYYLADTELSCQALSYDNITFSEEEGLTIEFTWSCSGSFPTSTDSYTFINFKPTYSYQIEIKAGNHDTLSVYEKPSKLINLEFNVIDGHQIYQQERVSMVIEQSIYAFATYQLGNFFKVKEGSTKVKITQDGVWIG